MEQIAMAVAVAVAVVLMRLVQMLHQQQVAQAGQVKPTLYVLERL
jgi:hypothetical protein